MNKINVDNLSKDLVLALKELEDTLNFKICNSGINIFAIQKKVKNITVQCKNNECHITYANKPQFLKAFTYYLGEKKDFTQDIILTTSFDDLTFMADCSRSAVLSVDGAKSIIRYLAVMGYNAFQLYTEDTYEVKEYPYMGYMRGRYTKEELTEIQSYCDIFGIELVPCIQTLAHLGQALRWGAHKDIKDIDNILLIDEEKTYEFIEALIRTCSETFTSKRINIGMDEVFLVGLGKYLNKHGYTDRSALMSKHLKRVVEICTKYGYHPMMWSDMFFYLQFKGNYWVADGTFSENVKDLIPEDVSIIYWDYHSVEPTRYDKMFTLHKDLHGDITFAGGIWRWSGFTPNNTFSLKASETSLNEAIKHNVKKVIVTAWGDDGCEASAYSTFPTLQLYSDMNYHQTTKDLRKNFYTTFGIEFDDFMLVDSPNLLPKNDISSPFINPSKYMLFQDVLMGLFDMHVLEYEDAKYFEQTSEKINEFVFSLPDDSLWKNLFEATKSLCDVLSKKCGLGIEIRKQYKEGDKEALRKIAEEDIPEIIKRVKIYYTQFKTLWMQTNKVIGLEVHDIRYGGLIMRLESVSERLLNYVDNKAQYLMELEQEQLPYSYAGATQSKNCYTNESLWQNIVSANAVGGV